MQPPTNQATLDELDQHEAMIHTKIKVSHKDKKKYGK